METRSKNEPRANDSEIQKDEKNVGLLPKKALSSFFFKCLVSLFGVRVSLQYNFVASIILKAIFQYYYEFFINTIVHSYTYAIN